MPCCRNQRPRHLSALCWQDAACMERRCRLSTVQAEQAIGYVHTWHKAPLLVPQVYPLPRLASCVPHVSSSPSARSGIRRDCAPCQLCRRALHARADALMLPTFVVRRSLAREVCDRVRVWHSLRTLSGVAQSQSSQLASSAHPAQSRHMMPAAPLRHGRALGHCCCTAAARRRQHNFAYRQQLRPAR